MAKFVTLLFEAPQSWFFSPGDYTFRLVADRVITGELLTAEFRLTLSADDVALLDQPGPDRFLAFPIE